MDITDMAYLKNLKKIGVNTTVLTTSLALAACGGGGGYYGDTNSNTNTNNPNDSGTVKEVAGVTIQLSKSTLKATGDTVEIIAKAVDKDGGGVSGKEINLNIKDSATNGATSDASTKTTGDDGTVKFTVTLDGSNKALTELLFTTTIVGTKIQNQSKATVTGAGTVVQSQYELKFDDITPLQVSGSEGAVRVRVLDNNGGGVPNENVSLTVKDFKNNNVTIKGASSAVTDNEGYVVFTLVLPKGKEADRAALIASGIALEATLTEQSGAIKTQISTAQVISVKNTMSSLTLSTSANNKIDAIGGTINVEVIAKNPEGLVVAGKDITLKLDDAAVEYGAKLANATVKTDENGKAIFTIKTEANSLNPTGQLLVNNGINITATSADGTVSSQVSKITVVSVATEDVSYLMEIGSNTIDVDNGEATVTVTAKDAKGGTVANKQINLTVPNSQNNGLTITNGSKITTDANGQAAFTLKFNKASVSANELNNLLANGVTVVASYNTVNSNTLTQTTRINFTNKNAVLEKDVQRIELTPTKGVVSAKNDTVQVKVRAISADGSFVANKSITLGLAPAVTENGVSVGGDKAVVKQTDASGYAIFTLNVDAFNQQSIDNLVKSGIAVAVSTTLADGSTVKQNTQIMVEAAPLQAVDVSYLSINPNSMINVKGGQTTVTVRAVDQNGGVLTDQDITLNIDQAQAYGLTIKNGSKAKTNAQGEAAFIVEYDGRTLDSAVLNELKTKGVLLTAKYQPTTGAAITQTSYVRYYEQSDNVEVKQLAISLGKGVVVASNDMFEVSVKAIDENGQPINGRKINLTLSDVAKNNGVKLVKPTELTVNGEAKFTVQLAAPNTDAVKALVDAGLLVTASVDNTNVSQTAKVMVVASNQGTVDVAYLAIEQLDAINVANNAERIVTVKAYNSSGIALTNKDIALSLSQSKGIRIKEGAVLTTNAAGEVKFTVVYEPTNLSKVDQAKLLQDGLVIDAKYGNSVSQTVKLTYFEAAKNIHRMDLVVDEPVLIVTPNNQTPPKVKATVTLKDDAGNVIPNRSVMVAINPEALQNGVAINGAINSGSLTVTTNAQGQYTVDLIVQPKDKNAVDVLVASGIGISASAIQADGNTEIKQSTKVTILSEASLSEVGYLITESSKTIGTTGGSSTITVKAFNSTGSALSGKTIQLGLNNVPTGLDIKLDMPSKPTNGNGEATFTVTYTAPKVLTPEQINGLLAGVQVVATYTNNKGINTTQNMTQQFAIDQVNIQRMDLVVEKPSLVMDTSTPQTVLTTVTLKDKDGNLIKNRQVTLAIDNWSVDNNVIKNSVNFEGVIGGSTVVETNANGQAIAVLEVKTTTKEAVDALVASGIGISALAIQGDGTGSVTQKTQITVSSAATLSELSYLTLDNVTGAIKTTGSNTATLTVKAFNSKGKVLAGKLVKLVLSNVPAGLTINVSPAQTTGTDGSASFTITYTAPANLSAEQIKGLLAGVQARAIYTTDAGTTVTQTTVLQFVTDDLEAAKDAQRLELITSKGIVTADNDTFTFTAKVFDKDGNPLQNKQVGFGLNAAATANGVTFVGGASKKTDVNGNATFTVNVKAGNDQMIENLVANGITLAASVVQADGSVLSQTIQVMVKAPVAKDVVALTTTLSEPVISVLGGTSILAVKAEDANGNPLANKEIDFGLAGGLSSRVKVDKTSATTNANGIAYFTVTVENGDSIDQLLVEKGITYAVSTYNNNSTTQPVVTQVGRVNVSVPTEAMNLTMDKTKADLLASGDTSEVFAKLVDNTAAGVKNYPVTFTVVDSALNGVTINGQATSVVTTDASGNAKVALKLTKITGKQYTDLLANGVTVRASITLPNGVVRTQTVHFNVNEASSNYHLVFSNVSKSAMDVNGDRSIVTVTLLDRANQPVRNQEVILAANNAGGLIIGNPGSSSPVNTSGEPLAVKTDSNGNAFFSVAIDETTVDKQLLLASGIELTATNTDEIGGKATQIYRIATVDNSGTPTVQPARYSLRIAAKPTMSVRDDTADVTVTLLDTNGGGVSGKYITLGLTDFARNGAVIVGASGLTTDANGQAVFKIKVDENARRNYTATEFVNDDLHLTARFNETGYADATQISMIDIVQAAVQAPVASIVIGVNPTEVASSSDGVYYTKNMSVSVVDFDGKPLANQVVTLDSTPLTYIKGRNLWALAPKAGSDPAEKWVFGNQEYYNLSAPNIYLDANGRPMNNNGTPSDLTDDYMASTTTNSIHACVASPAGTAVGANNTPVKVVTFVSQSGAEQNTFTTDANGKFDFAMRYPKIYAQWLTVQVGASATVASLPNRTTYSLGLASLASDYSSDGTYSPNEVSPYGTSFTCP